MITLVSGQTRAQQISPLEYQVAVVIDYAQFQRSGSQTEEFARGWMGDVHNLYSTTLEPSIEVTVVSMETRVLDDPWFSEGFRGGDGSVIADELLDGFSLWAEANVTGEYDAVILLSGFELSSGRLGAAYPATIGSSQPAAVVSTKFDSASDLIPASIAHHLGLVLGLSYDQDLGCAGSDVMSEFMSLANPPQRFSLCSSIELTELYNNDSAWAAALRNPRYIVGLDPQVQHTLSEAHQAVDALSDDALRNPRLVKALHAKLDAVTDLLTEAAAAADVTVAAALVAEALGKLEYDLLAKTNGCDNTGKPDGNDWIRSCADQEEFEAAIIALILSASP